MKLVKLGRFELSVYSYNDNTIKCEEKCARRNINYAKILATCSAMLTFAIAQAKIYATEVEKVNPLERIKQAEATLLDYGQGIGRIVCIVMCVFEIIKAVKDGDSSAFWGIILKYSLAYGSLHILPWVFDLIQGFFGG